MNLPRRTNQQSRFAMLPGRQLNPPRGGHVEPAAVGDDQARRPRAKRQVHRPQTIGGAVRFDEQRSFEQPSVIPRADDRAAVGKAASPDPHRAMRE